MHMKLHDYDYEITKTMHMNIHYSQFMVMLKVSLKQERDFKFKKFDIAN